MEIGDWKFEIWSLRFGDCSFFIVHFTLSLCYNRAILPLAGSMTLLLFVVIIFAAALLQSLSGFAFALITMPLVALVVGIRTATPLVAVAALTVLGGDSGLPQRSAAMYGMMGSLPNRGDLRELVLDLVEGFTEKKRD